MRRIEEASSWNYSLMYNAVLKIWISIIPDLPNVKYLYTMRCADIHKAFQLYENSFPLLSSLILCKFIVKVKAYHFDKGNVFPMFSDMQKQWFWDVYWLLFKMFSHFSIVIRKDQFSATHCICLHWFHSFGFSSLPHLYVKDIRLSFFFCLLLIKAKLAWLSVVVGENSSYISSFKGGNNNRKIETVIICSSLFWNKLLVVCIW